MREIIIDIITTTTTGFYQSETHGPAWLPGLAAGFQWSG